MKPIPTLLALLISSAIPSVCEAAILANYNFTTDLSSGDTETGSTASDIQSGGGLDAMDSGWGKSASLSDLYVRSTVTSTSLTADDYVFFTVTTTPGTAYDFSSLTFKFSAQLTSTGVGPFTTNAVVRSSLDNFATDLGTFSVLRVNANGTNVHSPEPSIDLSAYTNISGTIEFRIYIYDDMDHAQDLTRIDNIVLNGTEAIPEASGVTMISLGSLLLGLRRRRR